MCTAAVNPVQNSFLLKKIHPYLIGTVHLLQFSYHMQQHTMPYYEHQHPGLQYLKQMKCCCEREYPENGLQFLALLAELRTLGAKAFGRHLEGVEAEALGWNLVVVLLPWVFLHLQLRSPWKVDMVSVNLFH